MDGPKGIGRAVYEFITYCRLGFAVHVEVEEFARLRVVLELEIAGSAVQDKNKFFIPVFVETSAKYFGVDYTAKKK